MGDKIYLKVKDLAELATMCDDSTMHVEIETPEGWKCERENCRIDYLHKHTTYPALATQSNDGTRAQTNP